MLQLTDKAAVRLKAALSELEVDEGSCFRLGMTQEGVKIVIDQERPGDSTIEHDQEVLVVIHGASADQFEGRTMDFNEESDQLVFRLTGESIG
jgi:Fe-S cluster assembly iron-binding protein IscA